MVTFFNARGRFLAGNGIYLSAVHTKGRISQADSVQHNPAATAGVRELSTYSAVIQYSYLIE